MPGPWPTIDPATDEEGRFEICNPNHILDSLLASEDWGGIQAVEDYILHSSAQAAVQRLAMSPLERGIDSDRSSGGSWQRTR